MKRAILPFLFVISIAVVPFVAQAAGTANLSITAGGTTGSSYAVGQSWILHLTSNFPGTNFSLCAIDNQGVQSCTPWAVTDGSGSWTGMGSFDASTVGNWTEWVSFASQNVTSNNIVFTVNAATSGSTSAPVITPTQTTTQSGGSVSSINSTVNSALNSYLQSLNAELSTLHSQINNPPAAATTIQSSNLSCAPQLQTAIQQLQGVVANAQSETLPANVMAAMQNLANAITNLLNNFSCTTQPSTSGTALNTTGVATPRTTPELSLDEMTSGSYPVGAAWTLTLGSNVPNSSFTICAIDNNNTQSCTPNWGTTDANGNWTQAGNFDASTIGSWTEWIKFPDGTISNQIAFTVTANGSGTITSGTNPSNIKFPARILVTRTLNVRSSPRTTASLAGSRTLRAGNTFTAVGEVQGDSINGNDLWYVSSSGNYVWSGGAQVAAEVTSGSPNANSLPAPITKQVNDSKGNSYSVTYTYLSGGQIQAEFTYTYPNKDSWTQNLNIAFPAVAHGAHQYVISSPFNQMPQLVMADGSLYTFNASNDCDNFYGAAGCVEFDPDFTALIAAIKAAAPSPVVASTNSTSTLQQSVLGGSSPSGYLSLLVSSLQGAGYQISENTDALGQIIGMASKNGQPALYFNLGDQVATNVPSNSNGSCYLQAPDGGAPIPIEVSPDGTIPHISNNFNVVVDSGAYSAINWGGISNEEIQSDLLQAFLKGYYPYTQVGGLPQPTETPNANAIVIIAFANIPSVEYSYFDNNGQQVNQTINEAANTITLLPGSAGFNFVPSGSANLVVSALNAGKQVVVVTYNSQYFANLANDQASEFFGDTEHEMGHTLGLDDDYENGTSPMRGGDLASDGTIAIQPAIYNYLFDIQQKKTFTTVKCGTPQMLTSPSAGPNTGYVPIATNGSTNPNQILWVIQGSCTQDQLDNGYINYPLADGGCYLPTPTSSVVISFGNFPDQESETATCIDNYGNNYACASTDCGGAGQLACPVNTPQGTCLDSSGNPITCPGTNGFNPIPPPPPPEEGGYECASDGSCVYNAAGGPYSDSTCDNACVDNSGN